jgi:hypothetical protein
MRWESMAGVNETHEKHERLRELGVVCGGEHRLVLIVIIIIRRPEGQSVLSACSGLKDIDTERTFGVIREMRDPSPRHFGAIPLMPVPTMRPPVWPVGSVCEID